MKRRRTRYIHRPEEITEAASLFFAVRGIVRTKLAQGKKLDPSAWLRIETLKFIVDHNRPSMRALANYLSITAPSATSLVAGLIRDGLVTRATDARDRRAARLALTAKGKEVLAAALTRGMRLLSEIFSVLTPAELAGFIRALAQIKADAEMLD